SFEGGKDKTGNVPGPLLHGKLGLRIDLCQATGAFSWSTVAPLRRAGECKTWLGTALRRGKRLRSLSGELKSAITERFSSGLDQEIRPRGDSSCPGSFPCFRAWRSLRLPPCRPQIRRLRATCCKSRHAVAGTSSRPAWWISICPPAWTGQTAAISNRYATG